MSKSFGFFRLLFGFVAGGEPESSGATAARKATTSGYSERAEFFEGLINRAAADVAMEEVPDLASGKAAGRSLQGFEDTIGNGVSDAVAEEGGRGVGTVVPQGESRVEVRQLDDGTTVKSGVEGTEAQHLCFGAAGGGAVEASLGLAQSGVVVVPKFGGGRIAAKEDFALTLRPLDGTVETAGDGGELFGVEVAAIGQTLAALDAGPKAAVGEAVVGFGAVKRLRELALGDVTDEAEVASTGVDEPITVEEAQGYAIPGAAQQRGELERLRLMVCSTEASSSASTSRRRSPACWPMIPVRPRTVSRPLVTRFSAQAGSTSAKRRAIWFQLVPLRALLDSPTSTTKRFKV